jgi:hypothetical protein
MHRVVHAIVVVKTPNIDTKSQWVNWFHGPITLIILFVVCMKIVHGTNLNEVQVQINLKVDLSKHWHFHWHIVEVAHSPPPTLVKCLVD